MGKLIYLDDYRRPPYKEVLSVTRGLSHLQAFVNTATGELEVVQSNDEGEAITTVLTPDDLASLLSGLAGPTRAHKV